MGLYYTLHTGPYLECKTHMIDESEIKYGCQKAGCQVFNKLSSYKRYNYCSSCGSEIQEINFPTAVKAVDDRDFDFNGEELTVISEFLNLNELIDIWIANGNFLKRETTTDDSPSLQIITSEMIERECNIFAVEFEQFITKLKEKYDSVIVKWGVIGYSS
jgi:hypothetical protein